MNEILKDKPILSIIVPCYNTSAYVDEVLPSYIDERLFGKVKVLLIDDGATDDTAKKIKPYVENHPELFSFFHKENGGHGSVINYAIHNLVDTKYFKVIDGDDWANTNPLVEFADYLYQCDDDLVISDFIRRYPKLDDYFRSYKRKSVAKNKKSIDVNNLNDYYLTIHNATFKTKIWVSNNIRLTEHVFYEDNELRCFALPYIKTFSYVGLPIYIYRLGNPNQSVSSIVKNKHINDSITIRNSILNFYDSYSSREDFNKNIKKYIEYIYATGCSGIRTISDSNIEGRCKRQLLRGNIKMLKRRKSLYRTVKYASKFNFFHITTFFIFIR